MQTIIIFISYMTNKYNNLDPQRLVCIILYSKRMHIKEDKRITPPALFLIHYKWKNLRKRKWSKGVLYRDLYSMSLKGMTIDNARQHQIKISCIHHSFWTENAKSNHIYWVLSVMEIGVCLKENMLLKDYQHYLLQTQKKKKKKKQINWIFFLHYRFFFFFFEKTITKYFMGMITKISSIFA